MNLADNKKVTVKGNKSMNVKLKTEDNVKHTIEYPINSKAKICTRLVLIGLVQK